MTGSLCEERSGEVSQAARVLLVSQRNTYVPEVWRCFLHEFEEVICQIEQVDLLALRNLRYGARLLRNNSMRVGKYLGSVVNPGIAKERIDRSYDLLFLVCNKPSEVLHFTAVKGWKERCQKSVCWINEFWINEIPLYKSVLKQLSQFDLVVVNCRQSIEPIQDLVSAECVYLSPGVDTRLFCPYPDRPQRVIDVFSLGRRAAGTHQRLLQLSRESRLFYLYDTINSAEVRDLEEHRLLVANIAKRSRYFLVNPGKFDCRETAGGQSEIGTRYFEGAAAGAIMIGEAPRNDRFEKEFGWPDAVIRLEYGSREIDEMLEELESQPERRASIRRDNIVNALRNHDWLHRWESVLHRVGMKPGPKLEERRGMLEALAGRAQADAGLNVRHPPHVPILAESEASRTFAASAPQEP